MMPTIVLESTATTIGTTATRDQRDGQYVDVKDDTPANMSVAANINKLAVT